jgi:HSP20 family protein
MNVKKWSPWNWFREEEAGEGDSMPVRHKLQRPGSNMPSLFYGDDPVWNIHREIDRVFDDMFSRLGSPVPSLFNRPLSFPAMPETLLKPSIDIKERRNNYKITVEVPGVEEDDIRLELADGALTISGEKKHEKEESDEQYHSVERSYGSFRRVLSLPEDASEEGIEADFKKGVLNITVPRRRVEKAKEEVKQIEINK